jgi:serine/threonine protein phosphatase 1
MSLFARLLGRKTRDAGAAPGDSRQDRVSPHFASRLDDHRRVYAIGDIHGCVDLLDQLHGMIADDLRSAPAGTRSVVIYLGDYIDRGAGSRQVIDRLLWDPLAVSEAIHLCGNHDDFLLKFLEDPSVGPIWLKNGGTATMESYGVAVPSELDRETLRTIRDELESRLPEAHRDFFRRLRYSHSEGGYFFAHAGARPGIPLEAQSPYDLMWIRGDFLESNADFGKMVIHGHTPSKGVDRQPNRIGVVTGAFWTGQLTAAVLEGADVRFLFTGTPGERPPAA